MTIGCRMPCRTCGCGSSLAPGFSAVVPRSTRSRSTLVTGLEADGHTKGRPVYTVSFRRALRRSLLGLSCAAGGACGGPEAESPSRDGSVLTDSAAEAGTGLPSATDYADVTIEQDFTQPFTLPPPTTTIQGDATSLVGVWDEVRFDGGTCDPMHPGPGSECLHIEIQQDTSGALHGTIRADPLPNALNGQQQGPFASATDPNVGYPTTLDPTKYYYAKQQLCSSVGYRLFDPVFASGTFSFWYSPLDLWSDWCALQTPFGWNVRGQTKYECVPQTADSSTTDFGKLVLCRNANDEPQCTDSTGFQAPCVCFDDAGKAIGNTTNSFAQPLCSNSVCECTASQCRALLRPTALNATLTMNADELTGPLGTAPGNAFYFQLTFRRHP
jgi:hypothetical protein